jgi:putative nucleotidyltransferase with HDIG domain
VTTEAPAKSPLGLFARSRVARRIVVLFILCALLPVLGLAIVASTQVTRELRAASQQRLRQAAKSAGMDLIERLRTLETDMRLVASTLSAEPAGQQLAMFGPFRTRLTERFDSMAILSDGEQPRPLFGTAAPHPALTPREVEQLRSGRSVITFTVGPDHMSRIFMLTGSETDPSRVLVAEIHGAFLWNQQLVPPENELHALGPSQRWLFTSTGHELPHSVLRQVSSGSTTAAIDWVYEGETYIAGFWSLPLSYDFVQPAWTIVVSQRQADVLAPIERARVTLVLVAMLSLFVAMLLSFSQVRRSLVPLTSLMEGTRRLGRGDFDSQVTVKSGDEFEELAASFNTMSSQLKRLNVGTLTALARTVDAKSAWTAGHSQRVADTAGKIGQAYGLDTDALDIISRGSLLHDIGKIAVPTAILDKPARLTPEEYDLMKEHPRTGARILEPIPEYDRLIPIVLQHHEWFDGRGYPAGIAGEAISIEARIVAVADVFDALTSSRPYRRGMEPLDAHRIICDASGTHFDPQVVEAFRQVFEELRPAQPDDPSDALSMARIA